MAVDQIATKGLPGQVLNSDPANGGAAVTPSDTLDVFGQTVSVNSRCSRGLYVGGTGNLNLIMADGSSVLMATVPVGMYALRVRQVKSTSTTATTIVAFY